MIQVPYHKYESVIKFFEEAAKDERVNPYLKSFSTG
jgi:hypothetical protein